MLLQLHYQYEDGTIEFVAQTDIDISTEDNGRKEERDWMLEVAKDYPLPSGAIWMWCTENSKYFVLTQKETIK